MSPHQAGSTSASSTAVNANTLATLQQLLTQLSRTSASGSLPNMNPTIQSLLATIGGRLGNANALGNRLIFFNSSIARILIELSLRFTSKSRPGRNARTSAVAADLSGVVAGASSRFERVDAPEDELSRPLFHTVGQLSRVVGANSPGRRNGERTAHSYSLGEARSRFPKRYHRYLSS